METSQTNDACGQPTARPQRGNLAVSCDTSEPDAIAGRPVVLTVTITNPYEVPVHISAITVDPPRQLAALNKAAEQRDQLEQKKSRLLGLTKPPGRIRRMLQRSGATSTGPIAATDADTDGIIDRLLSMPKVSGVTKTAMKIIETEDSRYLPGGKQQLIEAEVHRIDEALKLVDGVSGDFILTPGSNKNYRVTLTPTGTIRFRPSTYSIDIEIAYIVDGQARSMTTKHQLKVRGALLAMLAGACVGGGAGWFVRRVFVSPGPWNYADIPGCIATALVAMGLTTLFERRTNAEPFISIGDFFGGLALGFVLGYMGPDAMNTYAKLKGSGGS